MSEVLVEIKKLTKRFGALTAVNDISFEVKRGEVLGFLGPNGAGKSTTMKMITGYLSPSSGSVLVGGHDVAKDPIAVKKRIGYLPEGAPAYPDMDPQGFLGFIADIRGYKGAEKKQRVDNAIAMTQLEGVRFQSIDTLSKGFKRRVGLAQAILHDPEILILDEPTDGLDPNQKHEVRSLIRKMAKDKAIILSTHILEEVHAVCTRAMIVAKGRVVADGTPAELEARSDYHNAVTLRIRGDQAGKLRKDLETLADVARVQELGKRHGVTGFRLFPKGGKAIVAEVSARARERKWDVEELHVETGRLDEVFRRITLGDAPAETVAANGEAEEGN